MGLRLALIDPHAMVRESLGGALAAMLPGSTVTYSGSGIADALPRLAEGLCDCAVLDPLAGGEGNEVRTVALVASVGVPVVVISSAAADQQAPLERACIAAGASAFVSKRQNVRWLAQEIHAVCSGRVAQRRMPQEDGPRSIALSAQEQRVLVLYASGLTVPQVALRLQLAPSTVKQYLDRVRDKSTLAGRTARTKTDLYRLARVQGLVP